MLSRVKPAAEKALGPVAVVFRRLNPNTITILGLIFPIIFFVLILKGWYWFAIVALFLCILDMIDGMIARQENKVSPFGAFLDSTLDRVADFVIITAFGFANLVHWYVVLPFLLFAYLTSYVRSRIELAAKDHNDKLLAGVGILERPERIIGIGVALLLYILFPHVMIWHQNTIALLFIVLIVLSVITVWQRFEFARKHL
ncbi:MAG TPA: CDP-alcohol phosphatidyltransferase family protein [Candidatus Saccharimonadales bacterium]|nr:CDP-alcohol phosphatidyltransferase family protein [Candidatus Saccharimonadales bacterium]